MGQLSNAKPRSINLEPLDPEPLKTRNPYRPGTPMDSDLQSTRNTYRPRTSKLVDPEPLNLQTRNPADLMGQLSNAKKRSINLALSHRGISALTKVSYTLRERETARA